MKQFDFFLSIESKMQPNSMIFSIFTTIVKNNNRLIHLGVGSGKSNWSPSSEVIQVNELGLEMEMLRKCIKLNSGPVYILHSVWKTKCRTT